VVPEGDRADGAQPWLPLCVRTLSNVLCFRLTFLLVVTREVEKQLPELARVKVGMANLFIKHTSASLSINENCDPDVRFVHYFVTLRYRQDQIC
jgi:hypothetical protein